MKKIFLYSCGIPNKFQDLGFSRMATPSTRARYDEGKRRRIRLRHCEEQSDVAIHVLKKQPGLPRLFQRLAMTSMSIAFLLSCNINLSACDVLAPLPPDLGERANHRPSLSPAKRLTASLETGSPQRLTTQPQAIKPLSPARALGGGEGNTGNGSPNRPPPVSPSRSAAQALGIEKIGQENGYSSLLPSSTNAGKSPPLERSAPVPPPPSGRPLLGGAGGSNPPSLPPLSRAGGGGGGAGGEDSAQAVPTSSSSAARRCLFSGGGGAAAADASQVSLPHPSRHPLLGSAGSSNPTPSSSSSAGSSSTEVRFLTRAASTVAQPPRVDEVAVVATATVTGRRQEIDTDLPVGSAVIELKEDIDELVMRRFPGSYGRQARMVLVDRLVTHAVAAGLLDGDSGRDFIVAALQDNNFRRVISALLIAQTVRKSLYDKQRMEKKLRQVRADPRNGGCPEQQIKINVIRFLVGEIIDIEKLKEFLPEAAVEEIVSLTVDNAVAGDMADIEYFAGANIATALGVRDETGDSASSGSTAEGRVETALTVRDDRVITFRPPLTAMITSELLLTSIRGGLRPLEITSQLVRDTIALQAAVVRSLSGTPVYNGVGQLIARSAVVARSLGGLTDSVVLDHSNPTLIRPGAGGRVVFFEVPKKDDLTQFKHIDDLSQEGGERDGIRWGKFVHAFNQADRYKPVVVIRFIQLRDYFDERLWAQVTRGQSLNCLLDFYNDPTKRFDEIHREIVGAETSADRDNAYARLSEGGRFAGVLKERYVNDTAVTTSVFEALTVANSLHQLCRPGGQEVSVISRRLDQCLLDLDDELGMVCYIFWDWNDPLKVRTRDRRDEQILIVSTGGKGSIMPNRAFGVWVDRSPVGVSSASQAALLASASAGGGSSRRIAGGSGGAAAVAASSTSSSVRAVPPPIAGGSTRPAAADTTRGAKGRGAPVPKGTSTGSDNRKVCAVM